MKNQYILLILISIFFLTGCQQTFFTSRKYAHRDYIRIGNHEKNLEVESKQVIESDSYLTENNTTVKASIISDSISGNQTKSTLWQHHISTRKPLIKKSSFQVNLPFKNHIHPKGAKKTNGSSALNVIGLAAAILALVGFFAAGIILLFSLLSVTLFMPGITLLWICFGLALVGMILGALGVGLKHEGKGMGIAALVIGSIVLFSVFLIVILIAAL